MTLLDTSVLVDAFAPGTITHDRFRRVLEHWDRVAVCTICLYEWLRGALTSEELAAQEAILPAADAWPFGPVEAVLAAELYRRVRRARQREIDLALAACALARGASVWTLNRKHFDDVPGLSLYEPA